METHPAPAAVVALHGLCLTLFFLRVIGQVYVGLYAPRWLPPMQQWYSGLLPYPALLPVQILLLMLMALASYDLARGTGLLLVESEGVRRFWVATSAVYAAGMLLRYIIRMARRPDQRWFGGTIPIFLHLVLALYLYLCAVGPVVGGGR